MKRLNQDQEKWRSPSAFEQDYRSHLPWRQVPKLWKLADKPRTELVEFTVSLAGLERLLTGRQIADVSSVAKPDVLADMKAGRFVDPCHRVAPLLAQHRLNQNQSKPRLAPTRPAHQLTIDQPYSGIHSIVFH